MQFVTIVCMCKGHWGELGEETAMVAVPELAPHVGPHTVVVVRTGCVWEGIWTKCRSRQAPMVEFTGPSPLRWVERKYNVEADHLCHKWVAAVAIDHGGQGSSVVHHPYYVASPNQLANPA